MGPGKTRLPEAAQSVAMLSEAAKESGIVLVGGSIPERTESAGAYTRSELNMSSSTTHS